MASRMSRSSSARRVVGRFLADERGATAIEYALLASGIGGAIIATVFALGTGITTNLYDKIAAML